MAIVLTTKPCIHAILIKVRLGVKDNSVLLLTGFHLQPGQLKHWPSIFRVIFSLWGMVFKAVMLGEFW